MADTNHPIAALHWVAIDVARYWNAVLVETATGQRHRFCMTKRLNALWLEAGVCLLDREQSRWSSLPLPGSSFRGGFKTLSCR
jgi:hypothetical protein